MRPVFSVVIPAYNQAQFIAETLNSVINQTFQDFEVLVVNDASTDTTGEVIAQFSDPRIRYIEHPNNLGLPSARNTGMAAALGKYIALLDADDIFLPEKLAVHHDFLECHPEIGLSYNARFELQHSSNQIRDLYRPPLQAGINDFIQGFLFTPSDMVVRAAVSAQVNHFDSSFVCGGEDLDYPLRLALAGCQFASTDQVLNYRRYHSGRLRKKLRCRIDDYTKAIEGALSDARCGDETRQIANTGLANHYSEVAWWAVMSGDRQLANEIIQQCIQLNPGMAEGVPSRLLESFFSRSIADHSVDHEPVMERIFSYLPNTVAHPGTLLHWYQARGHLLKGTLAIMWEQPEAGQRHFDAAAQRKARIDKSYIRWLTSKMLTYQRYFGEEKTQAVIDRLSPHLRTTGGSSEARAAIGSLWVNRAFANFRLKNYPSALREVRQAVINDPRYLFNRGVLSVAVRSYLRKSKTRAV